MDCLRFCCWLFTILLNNLHDFLFWRLFAVSLPLNICGIYQEHRGHRINRIEFVEIRPNIKTTFIHKIKTKFIFPTWAREHKSNHKTLWKLSNCHISHRYIIQYTEQYNVSYFTFNKLTFSTSETPEETCHLLQMGEQCGSQTIPPHPKANT